MCGDDSKRSPCPNVTISSLPGRVFVAGHEIPVKWMLDEVEDDLGVYLPDKRCIYIRRNQTNSIIASTVIHEVLHAMFDLMNLKDESKEEDVVSCYEVAVVGVLTDPRNKEFLKWAEKNI